MKIPGKSFRGHLRPPISQRAASPAPQPEPTPTTTGHKEYIVTNTQIEQPSQPAGAREPREEFIRLFEEDLKYYQQHHKRDSWLIMQGLERAEAYAKKERDRADAAERLAENRRKSYEAMAASEFGLRQDKGELLDEVESLRTELRDMREALEGVIVVIVDELPTATPRMLAAYKRATEVLSRKGEG